MRHFLKVLSVGVVLAALLIQAFAQAPAELQVFLSNLRNDQEILADLAFGGGTRPDSWTGNGDFTAQTIIADTWFDNELLADKILGVGVRPQTWIGATTTNATLVARNVRHDLEILGDALIGEGLRPSSWRGAPPIYRCDRTTQNIVYLLGTIYNITPRTDETVRDYCSAVVGELENELINATFGTEAGATSAIPSLILAIRGDLERLADEKLGLGSRPSGWRNNKDVNSPTLTDDNFADLELLADTLTGVRQRPAGWLGAISASPVISYRNLRHDLELLADVTLGVGVRPRGWQGEDLTLRCPPLVQNLVLLVERNYPFTATLSAELDTETLCTLLEQDANRTAENPPARFAEAESTEEAGETTRFNGESVYAFAYLDPSALQYMGSIPQGVQFRAWYRNFGESSMMFVSGENFAVFIDRRWTTLDEETFITLPTLDGRKPLTFCNADWCNGPRATPTPTGGGPLIDIITVATPPATLVPGTNTDSSGKRLVSWNHIRVTYVQQRPETKSAQVTLEICQEVTQITCEPVGGITNTVTGTGYPVLSSFNGLNVFELPYGYTTGLQIQGASLFSQDIWLNDPSLGG